jgi:hypothetical protein
MPKKSTALSFLFYISKTLTRPLGVLSTNNLQSPSTFFRGIENKTQQVVNNVSGSCMRKIQRHESSDFEESAPPMTGPTPLAMATTAP